MCVDFPLPSPPSKVMNLPVLAIFREIFRDDSVTFRSGQDLAPMLLFLMSILVSPLGLETRDWEDFTNATDSRKHRADGCGQRRWPGFHSSHSRRFRRPRAGNRRQRGV